MHRWGWAWVGLLISSGCTAEAVPAGVEGAPIASVASAECYSPPWLPKKLPADVRASACKTGERTFRFVLGSGRPATNDEEDAFLNAHRWEFHAIDGVVGSGWGLCCNEDKPEPNTECVAFDLRLCSTPLAEFVNAVRDIHAKDAKFADRSLRVSVRLEGFTGPRCAKDDPACGPQPYDDRNERPAPMVRIPVDPLDTDGDACSFDGECISNGCADGRASCDYWTEGGGFAACPFILAYSDAYCGCLEQRCTWFH